MESRDVARRVTRLWVLIKCVYELATLATAYRHLSDVYHYLALAYSLGCEFDVGRLFVGSESFSSICLVRIKILSKLLETRNFDTVIFTLVHS